MRCAIQPRLFLGGARVRACAAAPPPASRCITAVLVLMAAAAGPGAATSSSRPFPYPPPIVVPASSKQSATVIWMHGLGDTGNGWSGITSKLQLPWVKVRPPMHLLRVVTESRLSIVLCTFYLKALCNLSVSMPGT